MSRARGSVRGVGQTTERRKGRSAGFRTVMGRRAGASNLDCGKANAAMAIAGAVISKSAHQLSVATRATRKRAKRQLHAYRLQAQINLREWLIREARQGASLEKATLLRWRTHWLISDTGRWARKALAARVADYRCAAKQELCQATRSADGMHPTIDSILVHILRRDSEGSWEDRVLDRMVATWGKRLRPSRVDRDCRQGRRQCGVVKHAGS
jgi:hypothetical protein